MQIRDLIAKLETVYNTYTDEYKAIAGEPEIMIDTFKLKADQSREYAGFSNDIVICKTDDGVYDILSAYMKIKIKLKKPRNSLVVLGFFRKAGSHKISNRKLTKDIKKL